MSHPPRLLVELQIPAGWEETVQFLLADAGLGTALADWEFPAGAVGAEASLTGLAADRLVLVVLPAQEAEVRRRIDAWARDFGWAPEEWSLRVELRQVDDDAESWKRHWRPFRCANFEIRAPFHAAEQLPHRAGCRPLVLEVGSAFGTGTHATTRIALRAVRDALLAQPVDTMLDVGTGSGILAVAAALSGVRRVHGMDPDPQSPLQARRMAERNHVHRQCSFWQGTLESTSGRWPLVVANLVADLHVDFAPALAGLLSPGGAVDCRWNPC